MTMISNTAPRPLHIVSPDDQAFATTSWGEAARPRLSSLDTQGALAVMDYRAPAGFGPPRHLHRNDDEIFLIEAGHIVLWTPEGCRTAGPGDVVLLPRLMPHTWRSYGEDDVRIKVIVSPGEFETFFEDVAARGLTVDDVAALTEVAANAGMDICGPPLSDDEVATILRGENF